MNQQPASKMLRVPTPLIEWVNQLSRLYRQGKKEALFQGLSELISAIDSSEMESAITLSSIDSKVISELIQRVDRLEARVFPLDSSSDIISDSANDSSSDIRLIDDVGNDSSNDINGIDESDSGIDSSNDINGIDESDSGIDSSNDISSDSGSDINIIDESDSISDSITDISLGLTTAELIKKLGISQRQFYRLKRQNQLYGWKVTGSGKQLRYLPADEG
jgi:hypothetical protein